MKPLNSGGDYTLGEKDVNRIYNGTVENLDSNGLPYYIRAHWGKFGKKWGVSDKEKHEGKNSVWFMTSASGIVFCGGNKDYAQRGNSRYVIPAEPAEYVLTYWVKGDKNNITQPKIIAQIHPGKAGSGKKLHSGHVRGSNRINQLTPEWREYKTSFIVKGDVDRITPYIAKYISPYERKQKQNVSKIYIDNVSLRKKGGLNLAGSSIAEVLATCEKHIKVDWKKTAEKTVPSLKKIPFGTSVEPDKEIMDIPDYEPLPEDWREIKLDGLWKTKKLSNKVLYERVLTTCLPHQQNIQKARVKEYSDKIDEGMREGFCKIDYDDSKWTDETKLSYIDYFWLKPEKAVGVKWFRKSFTLPEDWKGGRIILHFARASYETTAYMNGKKVGYNCGGSYPFDFDVTDEVKPGKNTLAVRLFYRRGIPLRSSPMSGMYGVSLQLRPYIYAKNIRIDPKIKTSVIVIRTTIVNATGKKQTVPFTLNLKPSKANQRLKGRQGKAETIDLGEKHLVPGDNNLSFKVKIDQPVFWCPEYPYLYTLHLSNGKKTMIKERFGFREFVTSGTKFILNGKQICPNGFVEHDLPVDNTAGVRRVLRACKNLGASIIFPQRPLARPRKYYDICDELGMMIEEFQGFLRGPMGKRSGLEPIFDDEHIRNRFMFIYNHPSVVRYTIGHESRNRWDVKPINNAYDVIRSIDGQKRPICADTGMGAGQNFKYKTDFSDFHAYNGVFIGHPRDNTSTMQAFFNATVAAYGRLMPVTDFEMGSGIPFYWAEALISGREIFTAPKLDKQKLIQKLSAAQGSGGLGFNHAVLYGFRRVFTTDYEDMLQDPDLIPVKGEIQEYISTPKKRVALHFGKNQTVWLNKQVMESCRRLGNVMQGFGPQMYFSSLFNMKLKDGRIVRFNKNRLDDNSTSLIATFLCSTIKRVMNPRFICLNMFDKNCFAGGKLNFKIYAINDTQEKSAPWRVRVVIMDKNKKVLSDKSANIGMVETMKRDIFDYSYDIPEDLPTGFFDIRLYLLKDNEVISDNYYTFFVMNSRDLDKSVNTEGRKIAVYDVAKTKITTSDVMKKLGIKFTVINNFDNLANFDVLVIGANSLTQTMLKASDKINAWLKNGGRMLQFEQSKRKLSVICRKWL